MLGRSAVLSDQTQIQADVLGWTAGTLMFTFIQAPAREEEVRREVETFQEVRGSRGGEMSE